jgi:hypothetical protein
MGLTLSTETSKIIIVRKLFSFLENKQRCVLIYEKTFIPSSLFWEGVILSLSQNWDIAPQKNLMQNELCKTGYETTD